MRKFKGLEIHASINSEIDGEKGEYLFNFDEMRYIFRYTDGPVDGAMRKWGHIKFELDHNQAYWAHDDEPLDWTSWNVQVQGDDCELSNDTDAPTIIRLYSDWLISQALINNEEEVC